MMLPRLVTVRTALRRLLPCLAEDIDRRLVARMRHHVVRLEDRDGAAVEIVAGDHDMMAEPGLAHRLMLEFQPRRGFCAVGQHQRVMQADLHGNAAIDEAAQACERFLEPAFVILFPVAVIAERARGILPDLMEGAGAAVEGRRTPDRRPAERKAVARGAIGKQHIAFAVQAEHAEQSGEIAAAGIAVLGIALRPHPRHRVVGFVIRLDRRHRRYPVLVVALSGSDQRVHRLLAQLALVDAETSASQSAINSWPIVGLSCWQCSAPVSSSVDEAKRDIHALGFSVIVHLAGLRYAEHVVTAMQRRDRGTSCVRDGPRA